MISFQWDISPDTFYYNTALWVDALLVAVKQRIGLRSLEIGLWMQQNAPWVDKTGRARAYLTTDVVEIMGQAIVLYLQHGVSYGLFLETTNSGRYAIIAPAVDHWGPIIITDVRGIVSNASGRR